MGDQFVRLAQGTAGELVDGVHQRGPTGGVHST
jgi:hypothetical protein